MHSLENDECVPVQCSCDCRIDSSVNFNGFFFFMFDFSKCEVNQQEMLYLYHNDRGDFISLKTKPGPKEDLHKRCVHFYACICAFASDEKLQEEFEYYINLDANCKLGVNKVLITEVFIQQIIIFEQVKMHKIKMYW